MELLGHYIYRNNQEYRSSRSILPGPFIRIQIQRVPFQREEIPALHLEKKFLKRYSTPSWVGEWWVDVSHGIQGFSIPSGFHLCTITDGRGDIIYRAIGDPLGSEINSRGINSSSQ